MLSHFKMFAVIAISLAITTDQAHAQHVCTCGEEPGLSLTADTTKYWPLGHTIKVGFLDGSETQKAKVIKYATEWTKYASVRFKFGKHVKADIRITFAQGGSSSKVGTDALYVTDQTKPTMQFGWLTDVSSEASDKRVVLHEFGHALGFKHEHSNPDAKIPWDKDKVYAYYADSNNAAPPWSKAKVDHNLFKGLDRAQTFHSVPDTKSIMHYWVPNEHTIGDFSVPPNRYLSLLDKAMARKIYGGDECLVGDWNGDGKDWVAFRRGFKIHFDMDYDGKADKTIGFGNGDTDEYLVGDWNGDGKDGIAVRRGHKITMDILLNGQVDKTISYGNGDSDEYLVGDWNGDRKDTLAVRRRSGITMSFPPDGHKTIAFGNGDSDEYLVGDWNGNGKDGIAVRRDHKIIMDVLLDGKVDKTIAYGNGGSDEYLVGDWNGNGQDGIAVRRGSQIVFDVLLDGKVDWDRRFNPIK